MSHVQTPHRARRPHHMRLIAVTGHSGKTTTAWLVASVLGEAGLQVGVVSDLGCVDADGTLAGPPDRARPDDLVAWIARLARGGCRYAVVEVPHEALAAGVLGRGTCQGLVVTGAARGPRGARPGRALLERRALAALAPDGWLVAPPDPGLDGLRARAADAGRGSHVAAGLDEDCDISVRPVERGLHGQMLLLSGAGQVVPVAVDPPVASFARNAACAAAAGVCLGLTLDSAARGIEAAGSVAGRVERLDRGQDFAAFLDAPPNRHALASTLASLRRLTPGRLAVVAEQGAVDRLGPEVFARSVRRRCDGVVVVPPGVLADAADEAALAAYARIDAMLGGLGPRDCLLVIGSAGMPGRRGRAGAAVPLATLVDGWLRLAHPPRHAAAGRRRAA